MTTPTVSVIVPTHERLPLLREALDSVARQTYRQYEIIVIDDGSTQDILTGLRDHPVNPRVIRQTNQGPASARNRGIEAAQCDLVAFLDSDDLWLPDKLERFVNAMSSLKAPDIWYGPMSPISCDGASVAGRTKPCHEGDVTQPLFVSSFIHVPTVVCRKQILLDAGGFDERLPVCEDYDLWLRLSLTHRFGLIPQPLALRRLHDHRLSKSQMCRNLAVKAEMLRHFYDRPEARAKIDSRVASRRLARVFFSAGRAAFRGGRFRCAGECFAACRGYGHSTARTLPWTIAANALGVFSGADQTDSTRQTSSAAAQSINSM